MIAIEGRILIVPLFGLSAFALAQEALPPVCNDNRYGTAEQAGIIEIRMQSGSVDEVQAAIAAAQSTRGLELGCAEIAYDYAQNSMIEPTPPQIDAAWAVHLASADQAISAYDQCPALGRAAGAYLLGGWMARSGDPAFPIEPLLAISDNLVATQYSAARTPGQQPTWAGLFGYAESLGQTGSSCYQSGVVGESIAMVCGFAPQACVTYQTGRHAGQTFVVGDYFPELGARDGGAGFDQGWAGVAMVEAALGADNPEQREAYRRAAIAAGDWAIAEPPVRNHNYSAKLIWLLAVLYDWTGEERFREGLIDKLERNLLPGVLMDADGDGYVDSVPTLRFADLRAPAARMPGRMWDGHNALPWYQAMNAWAMVEAYAAFRSRGDAEWSERLRPYALAMLDNLAAEISSTGGFSSNRAGTVQAGFAFALALWKIADIENLDRPEWEQSLWSVWNAGLATSPGDIKTATAAIVALRNQGQTYRSYAERELALASLPPLDGRVSGAWFNPERSGEGLFVLAVSSDRLLVTWYTYDPADRDRQVWLIADGEFDGHRFDGSALITRGTRFGDPFDPDMVVREPWGTLSMEFDDCRTADLIWESDFPAYGSGQLPMTQLAATAGLPCLP